MLPTGISFWSQAGSRSLYGTGLLLLAHFFLEKVNKIITGFYTPYKEAFLRFKDKNSPFLRINNIFV